MNDIEKRARELFAEWHRQRGCSEQIIGECLNGNIQMPELAAQLVVMALTLPEGDTGIPTSVPEGFVPESAVLVCATRMRRLASAASPIARKAYITAAAAIEMTVSAAKQDSPDA